jgi:hypothetical protein
VIIKELVVFICLTTVLILSGCMSSGGIQTFSTTFGKVQMDIPFTVTPRDDLTSENRLPLVIPGERMPVINIWKSTKMELELYKDKGLEAFAVSFIGDVPKFEEMTTNDGHKMIFNSKYDRNDPDNNPLYSYRTFIDLRKDKNIMIYMASDSKTLDNRKAVGALESKENFLRICKSFTFI